MKTLIAVVLALLAGALTAGAQMPYPIWRNVGGTNYNLQPLYAWHSDMVVKAATRQATDELEKARPLSDWIGANIGEHFTVKEVRKPDLLLVEWQSGRGRTSTTQVVVQHYPANARVTEGQLLQFFACPSGHCAWTNQPGTVLSLPLLDYGTPCDTAQKVARVGTRPGGA